MPQTMRLSDYIRSLQRIQRRCRERGADPFVAVSRYSDLTTRLYDTFGGPPPAEEFPRLIQAHEAPGQNHEWYRRAHATSTEATVELVELAEGN